MNKHRCWTYSPGKQANRWDEFSAAGIMALDYNGIGDLNSYVSEDSVRTALQGAEGDTSSHKNDVRALIDFRDVMKPGDFVFAKKGQNIVVGVGRVTGDYYYVESEPNMRHRRKVDWIATQERRIVDKAAQKTLTDITSYPGFLVKFADAYNLEELYAEALNRLWDDFLARWHLDKLRSMTLNEYNALGSKDSFCYWLEKSAEDMGSIWGGSAYKFGIFEFNKTNPKPLDSGAAGDDQYRWYVKYGETAAEAFESVKDRILKIVEAAMSGDYAAVERIDFSPIVKWKIAFIYQSRDNPGVVNIYKKEMLMKAVGEVDNTVSMADLNVRAIGMIPDDMDKFVWARRKWLSVDDSNRSVEMTEKTGADGEKLSFDLTAIDALEEAVKESGLHYDDILMKRFVAALCAKPFIVLSGLSGSGKTKLAQAFVSWLSVGIKVVASAPKCFTPGLVIPGVRSEQTVVDVGDKGLIAAQGNGKCTCLSYEIINEWVETIRKNGYTKATGSGTIKDQVISEHPKYSPYLHAFDPVLKGLAFYQIEQEDSGKMKGSVNVCTSNWLLVPVGADWTNSEHLLGYPNALEPGKYVMPDTGVLKLMLDAHENPDIPFFLILDEMNLSHVERYFADFLSAMESGGDIKLYDGGQRYVDDAKAVAIPSRIRVPKNLYVIGTMNVDETTYMFSPKVLDRAQVIEFRIAKDAMEGYLSEPREINLGAMEGKGAQYAKSFLEKRGSVPVLSDNSAQTLREALSGFFEPLAELGAEFGYRTAFEATKFVSYYCEMGATIEEAIDAAVLQKLLPKLHGSQARLGPVLEKLVSLCKDRYPLSLDKLERMQKRLEVGFTSFAEA